MTPIEWTVALAPGVHWSPCYKQVEQEVRGFLTRFFGPYDPLVRPLGTRELVEHLWPDELCRGPVMLDARKRLFKAIGKLAKFQLSDCATRGPERLIMGRKSFPWLWHAAVPDRTPTREIHISKPAVNLYARFKIDEAIDLIECGEIEAAITMLRAVSSPDNPIREE